jgi:response regulator RpfG family c-di-GMP phosphodiesterase
MTHKLLIVDDESANLRLLQRLFSPQFHCLTASSGVEAIRVLEHHDIAIVITDQRMPMMTGIELLKRTATMRPHMVRILLTGYTDTDALVEAINSGLVYMYITKPWSNEDLKLRVNRACEHYENNKKRQAFADANQRLIQRLEDIKTSVVTALSEMLRISNGHAHGHALRVRNYSMILAGKLGVSKAQAQELAIAALLHEAQPDNRKTTAAMRESPLEQRAQDQRECEVKLLNAIPELEKVAELINCTYENYDGTGVPRGLHGDQIPLEGRILHLAVAYDLMVLPKAGAPLTHDEAMRFLTQRSGKQFDPDVLAAFSQLMPEELATGRDRKWGFEEYGLETRDYVEMPYSDSNTRASIEAALGISSHVSNS